MPSYDLVFLLKSMEKGALKDALTRTAKYILESGGILRKIENLGLQRTPFTMNRKGLKPQSTAHYFIFNYVAGIKENKIIVDKFKLDLDVLRTTALVDSPTPGGNLVEPPKPECTVYQDLLPPPYRPNVIEMLEAVKRRQKRNEKYKFKFNTGLDYDPF